MPTNPATRVALYARVSTHHGQDCTGPHSLDGLADKSQLVVGGCQGGPSAAWIDIGAIASDGVTGR